MSCHVLVTAGDKQAHEIDVPSDSVLVFCSKYVDWATAWVLKEVCSLPMGLTDSSHLNTVQAGWGH
jgi:hypothetical protein